MKSDEKKAMTAAMAELVNRVREAEVLLAGGESALRSKGATPPTPLEIQLTTRTLLGAHGVLEGSMATNGAPPTSEAEAWDDLAAKARYAVLSLLLLLDRERPAGPGEPD